MTRRQLGERRPDDLLDRARRHVRARAGAEDRRPARLDRGPARAVSRSPRSAFVVVDSRERHGDPDDDHPRRQRLRPEPGGDPPRAGPPVVRRPGDAARLARPVDVGGHDDVPPGRLGGRVRGCPPGAAAARLGGGGPGDARRGRAAGRHRTRRVRRGRGLLHPRADVARAARAPRGRRVLGPGPRAGPRSTTTATRRTTRSPRWWSDQTGEDLQPFFDEWLLGATTPDRS